MSLRKLSRVSFFISVGIRTFQSQPELYLGIEMGLYAMENESITQLLYCSSTVLCIAKTQWDTNITSKHFLG